MLLGKDFWEGVVYFKMVQFVYVFFTGRIIILGDVYIVLEMFRSELDEAEE